MTALSISKVNKDITEYNIDTSAGIISSSSTGPNPVLTVVKWQAQTFPGYKAPTPSAAH